MAFVDKYFYGIWIVISLCTGVASLFFLVLAIINLLNGQKSISISYLCVSIFLFGLSYSIKDTKFAKLAMMVGFMGANVTFLVALLSI